jgi:3-hydroxyisobutyrate dehydrogenase
MKIAVLGLGAMGSRMARRLLDTGEHDVIVWNRTAEAIRPLVEAGATAASTPAAAAQHCELVISMLRDDDAGRSVWLATDTGALAAMTPGAVAVECSTVTPAFAVELAGRCSRRGVDFLDAPVLGSRPQAEAGTLIFLVGGQPAVAHRVEPVGAGSRMKLLVNSLFAVQVAAVAELLGALNDTDLDAARAIEVFAATAVASPAAATAGTAMLGRTFPAAFPIELVAKDLHYAVADAATRHRAVPLARAAAAIYRQAIERGHGQDNITGVVQLFRAGTAG